MKLLTSITLAACLAVALTTTANAVPAPTLTPGSTTTDPLGIDNVVVDGTIYDVTFSLTTLNTFTTSTMQSTDANTALVAALNQLSVTDLDSASRPSVDILVDIDNTLSTFDAPTCLTFSSPCPVGGWTSGVAIGTFNLGSVNPNFFVEAADFTAVGTVTTPEPLTLSLFGAGLLGAATMRRRKAK